MSTVNCPNCNKPNIEGSKFCNSCGSALPPSTHIICPNCQTRNPKNLLYCDNCGTRLLATGELSSRREEEKEPEEEPRSPQAFSLPAREPGEELEPDQLLDWLRTGEEQPEEVKEQEAVLDDWLNELSDIEAEEAETGDDMADWFEEVGEGEGEEETADVAEWFADSDETGEEGGLADWLAELEEADEEEALGEPADVDESIPDWLDELEEDGPQEQSEEETFADWLDDFDLEEETAEEDSTLPETDILGLVEPVPPEEADTLIAQSPVEPSELEETPDWLSEIEDEEETAPGEIFQEEPEEFITGEDDTLIAPAPDLTEETEEEEALPDWFSEFETAEEAPTLIQPTPEPEEEEDLPDWLSDLGEKETELSLDSAAETPDKPEELPEWLSEAAPKEEAATAETAEEESLPDWLSEFEEGEETAADADLFEETAEEALSDWLEDLESPAVTAESFEAVVAEEAAADDGWSDDLFEDEPALDETIISETQEDVEEIDLEEVDDEGGLPDWLSDIPDYDTETRPSLGEEQEETADIFAEIDDSTFTPVDELPDWLSDVVPVEDESVKEEAEEPEDDLFPDWLSELSEEAESLEAEGDTDWLAALAKKESWPEVPADEEIEAQLDELEEETAEPSGLSQELRGVPKELVGSDLPDWLEAEMPASDEPVDTPEGDLFEMEGEQITPGELPDWLQEVKPAEMEPSAEGLGLEADFLPAETQDEWRNILENMPSAEDSVTGASALQAAEIPAWLQSLKPRDIGAVETELPDIDEPPETEGPLAGLRGVLPVAAVIAEPAAATAPAQYTIPKEQQQQISLLHRLTHEEPAATKQVSFKKAAAFSNAWRVLLGIVLFLVVLAGVILPRTDFGMPETSLPVPQSALDTFTTINDDEISGRSVLVAFEYTPAMSGELDPIALMLMRQLAENGNRVVTISQSAVGTAIAGRLVGEVDGLDSRALPLLPGEAVGLRSLAACLNSAESCEPLYGNENTELLSNLADIGLIIVLTSDRNSLVNWIEQVEREYDVPVIAAVTQPLGPLTIPYLSSGQLEGSLDGIPAASAYEKRLRGLDGSAFEQFTAQTIVMWVVIISLIIASVIYGVSGLAGGGQNKGGG